MKLNGTFKKIQICDHSKFLKCLYSKKKRLKQLNGKECNDIKRNCDLCYRDVDTCFLQTEIIYRKDLKQKQW